MQRSSKRENRAAQKRLAAAINVAVLGLAFVIVPHLPGQSVFTAMLRPLAPLGWLMLLGGGLVTWLLVRKPNLAAVQTPRAQASASRRSRQLPTRPAPLVERIDSAYGSVFEPIGIAGAKQERRTPTTWGPQVFAVIEWRRFEALVEALFAQAGFLTKAQSHGPDEGVDVWLYSKNQPDGAPVSMVQCKHWQGKPVGVDKVRELRGVMAAKDVLRGQFATTSTFTSDAVVFAGSSGIKLHDGAGLLSLIATRSVEQQQALLDVALEGDYWRPTCASCGIKLIERESMAGGKPFWGCSNFPRCRTTMQMRAA